MDTENLEYKPSLSGRIARLVLPTLNKILPKKVYYLVYDNLRRLNQNLGTLSYRAKAKMSAKPEDKNAALRQKTVSDLLPFTMGGYKALENAFDVVAEMEATNVDGAIVECGVARGGTAGVMAVTSRELGTTDRQRPIWLFDSYEGLPEPTDEDYVEGQVGDLITPLQAGECLGTIEQVSGLMFDKLGFDQEDVTLVKGWFQDTVPGAASKIGSVAVLRLDGDWYESTKIPLDEFYPHIPIGGAVIVDDYATCHGSKRAVDEFVANLSYDVDLTPDGRGGVWWKKEQ